LTRIQKGIIQRKSCGPCIGFVGEDNQGLDGIEKTMEKYLKGVPGKILSEVDAQGRQMPNYENKRIDPQDGLNVVLTIDENIQYFAEEALQKAIEDNKVANGAFAIVMDPETEKFWRWYQNLILISTIPEPARRQKILPHGPDFTEGCGNLVQDSMEKQGGFGYL